VPQLSLDFAYAYGRPVSYALFRVEPEDFIVDEILDHELTGSGEHFWLQIRKRGENTDWIAKKLANYFSVRQLDVGYAGKKDRHAVTTQWFSLYLPKQAHQIDWQAFLEMSGVAAELLQQTSHRSKLKKGEHTANTFTIRLREIKQSDELATRLASIKADGVPNYFGQQRFGRDAGNLDKAEQWAKDPRSIRNKNLRSMIISSARSYLFNLVLSARVSSGNWAQHLPGEPTESASGPLWGRGRSKAAEATLELEEALLDSWASWCAALENVGLAQERRALVLRPQNLNWHFEEDSLLIGMTLNPGQYATAVLRELCALKEEQR